MNKDTSHAFFFSKTRLQVATYALATIIEAGCHPSSLKESLPESEGSFFDDLDLIIIPPLGESQFSDEIQSYLQEVNFIMTMANEVGASVSPILKALAQKNFSSSIPLSVKARDCFRAVAIGLSAGMSISESLATYSKILRINPDLTPKDLRNELLGSLEQYVLEAMDVIETLGGSLADFLMFVSDISAVNDKRALRMECQ